MLLVALVMVPAANATEPDAFVLSKNATVRAATIRLEPTNNLLFARGSCSLSIGDLQIDASSLTLDLRNRLVIFREPTLLGYRGLDLSGSHALVDLDAGTLELREPELRPRGRRGGMLATAQAARCQDGACRLLEASATACPHEPAGYRIRADEILFHQSGDMDLERPVLELSDQPMFALPWLRLRPPGKAGFLPPRLGWDKDGGLIVGPAGYIPLGDSVSAQGHIAVRTRQGLESRTELHTPDLSLSLDHLLDLPKNSIRLRGQTTTQLLGATLAGQVDVVTDRYIIDGLAQDPLERAVTHTVSRGLLAADFKGLLVESYIELLQEFDRRGRIAADILSPRATIELGLPATPLASFFWPSFDLSFTRVGFEGTDPLPDASTGLATGHSRLGLSYGVDVPHRLGPLATELRAKGIHRAWLLDGTETPPLAVHLISSEAYVGLPLARSFDALRHRIEPFIRYRLTPWLWGSTPEWVIDGQDRLRPGQGLEAGFTTQLDGRQPLPIVRVDIKERFDLPGLGAKPGPAYLAASVHGGPRWLSIAVDGSWDHTQDLPSTAGVSLSSQPSQGNRFDIGGRWVGPGRGPHRDQPFTEATGPALTALWPAWIGNRVEVYEELEIALTRHLGASTGTRIGVWPKRALHALWYGLRLRSSCGCIAAGITASHRLDAAVPDVMATLHLVGI